MKTTNFISDGGVQLAGKAVLMSGLPGSEAVTPLSGTARKEKLPESSGFPSKHLVISLCLTAITITWTSLVSFNQLPVTVPISGGVSLGLLLGCLVSWFGTTRALFRFDRAAEVNANKAAGITHVMQERDLMRMILDHIPDCIYAKDTEGHFIFNNVAHARSLGAHTPADMTGKSDFDFFPRELAAQFYADEKKIIETGTPVINQEQYKEVHGRGTKENRWSYATKVLWRDPQGKVIGTAGVTRDIHEDKMTQEALRQSEVKLRQFTIQLERSNRELQDFAYVASHDLQEPLRKIVVFGERLKEKCNEALTTDGRDYLERMQKAASRMQVLISDLLSFSRITSKAQAFTSVNLSKTAHEVVGDLEGRLEQVKGRVELGPLPTVQAEHSQMRQLLQNLIGNALKFRRPEVPPVVRVEAKIISAVRPRAGQGAVAEDICELTISDNGIGFDEKYLDKIFNVFQRLHTRNEYEGTGMGLAIAKKIVLYHGGDITAKSKPGHGATFIVTLPVAHPKDNEAHHE
jgi:PAS domain S-box-containing protein